MFSCEVHTSKTNHLRNIYSQKYNYNSMKCLNDWAWLSIIIAIDIRIENGATESVRFEKRIVLDGPVSNRKCDGTLRKSGQTR
jgi:hypothetical protein